MRLRNDRLIGHHVNFFRAMRACTGALIAPCDQDDVWHPCKLAECEQPFGRAPRVSLVAHSAQAVDEYLRPQGWTHQSFNIRKRRVLPAGSLQPGSCLPALR